MREIKYRQALMDFGKFCGWHYWGFIGGKFVEPAFSDRSGVEPALKHSQEYTGLKYKNGKEIYEGDIVEATILPAPNGNGVKGLVEYLQGQFDIDFNRGGGNRRYSIRERQLLGRPNTIQDFIVGNIYENPELLSQ